MPCTMFRNHRTRLLTALFALVSLLFMQLAVASYACPGLPGSGATSSAVAKSVMGAMAGMPCAEEMAMDPVDSEPAQLGQANLCHAHCQVGQQSADKYEPPSPVHITALPANFTILITAPVFSSTLVQATTLKRTTAPPLALQNCCLRL